MGMAVEHQMGWQFFIFIFLFLNICRSPEESVYSSVLFVAVLCVLAAKLV
jgi:Na+/H+ antiporter NhaA